MNIRIKSLVGHIFPALGVLFVTYLYNVIDGIFVGQGVVSATLGVVNIGVSFIAFAVAIVAMFPIGEAIVVAIHRGRGDKKGANHAFMMAYVMTFVIFIFLMFVGMVFVGQIIDFSEACKLSVEMREMSK